MVILEDIGLMKVRGNETTTETVKSIRFSKDGYKYEMDGVINILNSNWTLNDIFNDIIYRLEKEKDGVKAISELEPYTDLYIRNIQDCNTTWAISEELYDLDEQTILITEDIIKRAEIAVKEYESIINALNTFKRI